MNSESNRLDRIVRAAMQIRSPEERMSFLATECGDDSSLRRQVEGQLKANVEASGIPQEPTGEKTILTGEFSPPNVDQPGDAYQDQIAALEAGLAAAFVGDPHQHFGEASPSVLSRLAGTVHVVPRVVLPEGPDTPSPSNPSGVTPADGMASRYQVEGEIARGGMGAILKGRDNDLGRELAIKVLLDVHKDRPEVVQRFIEEAQIGGQLQHPGIAPIYELGQFADQRPFFSMKLVRGETLSKLLAKRADPSEDRGRFIGIFEQICQTMAYAHSRSVIHRDLKPANVMVGAFGEVQVMDWGLAKVLPTENRPKRPLTPAKPLDQSSVLTLRSNSSGVSSGISGTQTQMGTVLGTPAYMPPEQALGDVDHLDERADVFGLGAILCEILTGLPPYVAREGMGVYRLATLGKLDDCFARLDACGADAELLLLAKECLEPDPDKRLRDANVLAARVSAHIESVETRLHASELERVAEVARAEEALLTAKEHEAAARAERRARRMQLGFAGVVLFAVTIGGIAAVWTAAYQTRLKNLAIQAEGREHLARMDESKERERAQREEQRAKRETLRAEAEKLRSDRLSAGLAFDRGMRACTDGQITEGLLWMTESLGVIPAEDINFARVVGSNISRWCAEQLSLRWMIPLEHKTETVVYSPDGRFVVAGDGGTVRWFDATTGEPTGKTLANTGEIMCIAFSPDGNVLATGSIDRELRVWDVEAGQLKYPPISQPSTVCGLDFSKSGNQLAVATGVAYLDVPAFARVYDVGTGQPVSPPLEHPEAVRGIRFHFNDSSVLTVCNDGLLRTWDIATGKVSGEPVRFPYELNCMATNRARDLLAVGCGRDVHLIYVPGMNIMGTPLVHSDTTNWIAFDPTQHFILTLGQDRLARVWNWSARELVGEPLLHQNYVKSGAFSPDGLSFVTGSEDRHVRIVDLPLNAMMGIPVDKTDPQLMLLNNPRNLTSARPRTYVTGRLPEKIPHWIWGFLSASFSDDGRLVVTGSMDHHAYVWELATGKMVGKPLPHANWVRTVAFHPDSRRVVTGSHDMTARVWDAMTGEPLTPPMINPAEVSWAEFNSDGSLILISSGRAVQLWSTDIGTAYGLPMQHPEGVLAACLSHDSRTVATAIDGPKPRIQFWDVTTTRPLGPPLFSLRTVTGMRFEQGDRTLLTCSDEGSTRRWVLPPESLPTPELLRLLPQVLTGQKFDSDKVQRPIEANEHHKLRRKALAGEEVARQESDFWRLPLNNPSSKLILDWHDRQAALLEISFDGAASYAHFERLLETRQGDWTLFARFAASLHRYGGEPRTSELWEKARGFATPEQLRDWSAERALQKERVHYANEALWFRQKALDLDPEDIESRRAMGNCFARLGRFQEAKEQFEIVVKLAPQEPEGVRDLALVQLALRDREGYRKSCQRLLELAQKNDDIEVAYMTALTCVLDPESVSDWSPIVELATRCSTAYEGDRCLLIAALYRAGRFDSELIYKEKTTQVRFTHNVWEWLFQGMLQVKAGQKESGQTIIREKIEMVSLMDQYFPRDTASQIWTDWVYHVQCHTLVEEAKLLLP